MTNDRLHYEKQKKGETCREKETDSRGNSAYYDIVSKSGTNVSSSLYSFEANCWDFPGGSVVRSPSVNAGDTGSIPGPGIFHMLRGNKALTLQLLKSKHPRACALK